MSNAQLQALAQAKKRSRKVQRAASFAAFSGWSMAFFAIISILMGAFGDTTSLIAGIALAIIAANELRGARRLAHFDESGARLLAINQGALGVLIVLYAAWSIYAVTRKPGLQGMLSPEEAGQLSSVLSDSQAPLIRTVYTAFYTVVALGGVLVTGLTAWYYLSRAAVVRKFRAETPPWAVEALRTTLAS